MLEHTAREAKRLGLGVDMATGTGWPFGGPVVPTEDSNSGSRWSAASLPAHPPR